MEILELHLKHFGKFTDHIVKFHPGVNVIYGENETGKSTIHAFIRAMFFGFHKGRGKKDEYVLRQPWENPSYFAGIMRLKHHGEIYRIERNFYRSDRDVRLICESQGRELPADDAAFQELLGGLNEAAFRNTFFIPQGGNETEESLMEQLRCYMVNFQESRDGDMDVSEALGRLKQKRKEIETEKRREQEILDEKISQNQVEINYVKRELARSAGPYAGAGDQRGAPFQEGGSAGGSFEVSMDRSEGSFSGTDTDKAEGRFSEAGMDRISGRSSLADTDSGAALPSRAETNGNFFYTFLRWLNILLPVCGLLGIGCGILSPQIGRKLFFLILGILFLVLFIITFLFTWKEKTEPKISAPEMSLRENTAEEGTTRDSLEKKLERTLERRLEQRLEGEKQAWRKEERRKLKKERTRKLEVLDQEMQSLYREREKLAGFDREMEAVDLAMLRIRELSTRMVQEAGGDFNRIASEILAELTDGVYTQIALDDHMQVRINTPSRLLYLYQVSQGTMDQIYFAMRMAAGILLTGGAPLPIILDEPFAMYDQERLSAVLRWLRGSGRQVILFTSQKRVMELRE